MADLAQNLIDVRARIAAAARSCGRQADEITLIAVSKKHDADAVRKAIAAGQSVFGENRVQEAQAKWPEIRREHPDVQLHLIGPLQSNKTADAVGLFDVIHTVDREKIARAIAAERSRQGRDPALLVQVNTGREPQKAGIDPLETTEFIDFCRGELDLPIRGLMCIPPVGDNPGPHFALLAKLATGSALAWLSMGMSGDYETAVELGATHVRIGTAIFGERDYGKT